MINQQLPALPAPSGNIRLSEILEAFAFTYLSAYNSSPIAPRVNQAFTRAWNPDQIINVPRIISGRPGATVAIWTQEQNVRVIVAIEGVQSINDIGSFLDATGADSLTGVSGFVPSLWITWANALKTALQANSIINSYVFQRNTQVTFCGHSAGAALAEVLAVITKNMLRTKPVRLIKFGSPRVGTQSWILRFPSAIWRASCYNEKDPVWLYPPAGRVPLLSQVLNASLPATTYLADADPRRFTKSRGLLCYYDQGRGNNVVAQTSAYLGDPLVPSFWPDHPMDAYRLTFMNYAAQQGDALNWRFNALEFNDENNWQLLFRPGIRLSDLPHTLLSPPPDDIGPPTASAGQQAIDTDVGAHAGGDVGGGDWGGGDISDSFQQDVPWGGGQVLTTALLPQRRIARR